MPMSNKADSVTWSTILPNAACLAWKQDTTRESHALPSFLVEAAIIVSWK